MTIQHARVLRSFTVADPSGNIEILEGQILMGEAYDDIFTFSLTAGADTLHVAEPIDNGNVAVIPGKIVRI